MYPLYYDIMEYLNQAKIIIDKTKEELVLVISTAMKENKLDEAERILNYLRQMPNIDFLSKSNEYNKESDTGFENLVQLTSKKAGNEKSKLAGKFPKFIRRNDDVVKIGWSRKENSTYEHKADLKTVGATVKKIIAIGKKGAVFNAFTLLPISINGITVPDYQAYLILKWLVHGGLVKQHGRKGYSIVDSSNFEMNVNKMWEGLENES